MAVVLREVARKAGVSLATASLAIRDGGRISGQTREKVKKAAKQLGFRPNASAKALVSGSANAVSVVVQEIYYLAGAYMASVLSGIAEISDNRGYGVMFARSGQESKQSEPEYVRLVGESRYDGLVVIDQLAKKSDLQILSEAGIPVVLIDRKIDGLGLPSVCTDYHDITKKMVNHLIGLGHRRIVAITYSKTLYEFKEKLAGYEEALVENGIGVDPSLIITYNNSHGDYAAWLRSCVGQLESKERPPTAYICLAATVSLTLCEICRSRGLQVPGDVSVVDYDASEVYTCSKLYGIDSVGVVKVPGYEMGVRACQLLLDLIQGRAATKEILLEATFEPRNGCAKPGR